MSDEPPFPKQFAWFAPWRWFAHWKAWKRWTLLAVMILVGYIELPVFRFALIILEISTDSTVSIPRPVADGMYFACVPLFWCMENCKAVDLFYEVQINYLSFWISSIF